ncbi:MAG: LCP family protein [Clostridia bacterium]|nr:LCP family protein [Clostridia bacterium]
MSDKNIDYQMYLDYLNGNPKEGGEAPKPTAESIREAEAFSHKYEDVPEKEKPLVPFDESEYHSESAAKPLSRIEEIEKKYHLDHNGEEKDVHLMTDEEFAEKYSSKNSYKKSRARKEEYSSAHAAERREAYAEEGSENSGYEDVYSYDSDKENTMPDEQGAAYDETPAQPEAGNGNGDKPRKPKKGKKGGKGKDKKKKILIILAIVLVLIGALGTVAYVKRAAIIQYFTGKMMEGNKMGDEDTGVLKRLEEGDDQNHGDKFLEGSAAETYSLEDWLRSWQTMSGELMYNDQIINVLLIGMDDPEGDKYGRSDAMILLSIDTINQKLKLTSVWRDTYGYIQVPNGQGVCEKINGANYYGGPELTVKTIESLYKTRIDGYVMTTFDSFRDLIDAMGGIYVDVTEEENEFLTETAQYSWHASAGKHVKLNGLEALVYSRIRKLDSDIARTERQRKVMSAMLDRIGELSTTELFKAVNIYLEKGYITTNFSQNEISGLGTKAVFGGWKDFEMEQMTAPISGEVDESNYEYYWGGTYNGAWVWLVDIPKTATDVQKFIYGETYCQLNENRHRLSEFTQGSGIH